MVPSEAQLGRELLQPSVSCEEEFFCARNITRWLGGPAIICCVELQLRAER